MKKKNQSIPDREQLKIANELKKMELTLKTGAVFNTNPNSEVSPEIENQFLKNIEEFEESWQNAKNITIRQKIGNPEITRPENLSQREVTEELRKIMDILEQHNISLGTICPVDDITLYTFIVDEFMNSEIYDMNIPGMTQCYIYEEYHPNHEYDIKRLVESVVKDLLNKSTSEFENIDLKYIDNYPELLVFTRAFEKFKIQHLNITSIHIEDNKAEALFDIKFTGHMEVSTGKIVFTGMGKATLENKDSYWWVKYLELPT